MPLSAGTKLGPYEILSPIGAGGMGEVWKARDTRLNRVVAIKQLKGAANSRFEQEARAIAALNHPHICQIFDVGPDFLVLEYVEGRPLQGPLPAPDALRLAAQIASALDAAHKRGILHRDLKPGNVIVTEAGAKLLDFGLAKWTQTELTDDGSDATLTVDGSILGTPAYMSPEQARGKGTDPRSDVFSFGAILYELLSGQRAFQGASMIEVLGAVALGEPAPLPPSDLARVAMRCLRKAPAERFQTMAEVCAALKQGLPANPDEKPSIAVLPFANIGRDDADEFFSDGLAEDVINALAKLPGLKVIARTSAFAFKGQNSDIRKIAETLGVANILEGSVRRSGSRVRVTAQLVAASDGSHLWSERYDRQLDDLFAMQDEIAESIAAELRLKFAPAEHPRRQPNLQAYEAYLRYRQYQWLFTPEAFARSRTCLEQAIALDPEYALAYAGLADHYFALTTLGNAGELVPKARSLAERALELDPDLSEAHGMLGVLAAYLHPDWDEAERRFVLATAREPVPWQVRSWHSTFFLRPLGRCAEAQREAERAIEDNPLSQMLSWALGNVLAGAGRPDEALSAYNKAAELDPQFWAAFWSRGMWHAVSGRQAEALANAEKAVSIFPNAYTTGLLAGLLHQGGEAARAEELLQRADTPASICYHTVRGDVDKAVELSCAALDEGHQILSNSFLMPFEPLLRQSSGWPTLMRKMNLPETR